MSAVAAAAALGIVLAALGRTRFGRFLPSAVAMGIGFITPAYYAVPMGLGALLFAAIRARWPEPTEKYAIAIGAGATAGEGLMGVVVAILILVGLLRAS
jgi:uncharacterized oligopeptide transporter (OPT) family protein